MTERYSDYEELRPLGEATHIPDDELSGGDDGELRRQREGGVGAGYPDHTTATAAEYVSCGMSISAGQTRCRFCLTNHLDAPTDGQDTSDSECDVLHVTRSLVESRTFYGAAVKGSAACSLLAKSSSNPAVVDCGLIYDLDEEPAAQLADQWPSLPSAARVTSERSEQLLTAARERTAREGGTQSRHGGECVTFLYDETGSGIHEEDRLVTLLEDADVDVWLVPAIALQRSTEDTKTENLRHETPNRAHLKCRECGRETDHQFFEFEYVPDDEWTGQPMWECNVCRTPRYGPKPEGVGRQDIRLNQLCGVNA